MIINYCSILFFIIVSFVTGLAFISITGIIKWDYEGIAYICIPAGVAINVIIAAFAYFRLKASSSGVKAIWLTIAVMAVVYIVFIFRKNGYKPGFYIRALMLLLVLFFLMTIPGVFKGGNYYVYKGNVYDKYSYISEASYAVNHTADYTEEEMEKEEYYPDALRVGYFYIVNDRPLAGMTCGFIALGGDIFFLGYLYTCFMWAMISGPMILVAEAVFPQRARWKYLCFSILYVFSIYCQLQNDIDAWSQLCSAAVLISFSILWIILLKKVLLKNESVSTGSVIGLGILGTGAFMIYAEATWLYGLILVSLTFFAFAGKKAFGRWREIAKSALIPVIMLIMCYIAHPGTFKCAFGHILFATGNANQSWALFYDYWLGYHEFIAATHTGAVIKKLLTIVPSWSGMYMITPVYTGISKYIIGIWLLALGILSVGIIGLFLYSIYRAVKYINDGQCFVESMLLSAAVISVIFFLICICNGKYMTASKSLLFVSHYIYIYLAMPFMKRFMSYGDEDKSSLRIRMIGRKVFLAVSGVFVICQIVALGLRLCNIISDKDGIMHMGYYYPHMESEVKEQFRFDFDSGRYADESVVAITGCRDKYSQQYIQLCLEYEDVDYYLAKGWDSNNEYIVREITKGDTVVNLADYFKD